MANIYISFYLKLGSVRIFSEALRQIGSPSRIAICISNDGKSLLLVPYNKADLKSHKVPKRAYEPEGRMEIYSNKLCDVISNKHGWEKNQSYRVPGKLYEDKNCIIFDLTKALMIL